MLQKIKFKTLSAIATLSLAVAAMEVGTASFMLLYQPEVPEHLKDS